MALLVAAPAPAEVVVVVAASSVDDASDAGAASASAGGVEAVTEVRTPASTARGTAEEERRLASRVRAKTRVLVNGLIDRMEDGEDNDNGQSWEKGKERRQRQQQTTRRKTEKKKSTTYLRCTG
jgi:hypothetical protein